MWRYVNCRPRSLLIVVLLAGLLSFRAAAVEREELSIQEWLQLFVAACVGSGELTTFEVAALGPSDELLLQSKNLDGSVRGSVTIKKEEYSLLQGGINEVLSSAQVDQADKVRQCLNPFRRDLQMLMRKQLSGESAIFLSPYYFNGEEEHEIMCALASIKGRAGRWGEGAEFVEIATSVGISHPRLRLNIESLKNKGLVSISPRASDGEITVNQALNNLFANWVYSLTSKGDDYVVESRCDC